MVTSKYAVGLRLPVNWEKSSTPEVAPTGCEVKENRPPALGFAEAPVEVNEPNVTPVAVGGAVGSVVPEAVVTETKS